MPAEPIQPYRAYYRVFQILGIQPHSAQPHGVQPHKIRCLRHRISTCGFDNNCHVTDTSNHTSLRDTIENTTSGTGLKINKFLVLILPKDLTVSSDQINYWPQSETRKRLQFADRLLVVRSCCYAKEYSDIHPARTVQSWTCSKSPIKSEDPAIITWLLLKLNHEQHPVP